MISFYNISVMNFDNAIRGMRNPLNSWDKSDSYYCSEETPDSVCMSCKYQGDRFNGECVCPYDTDFIIGDKDLALAQRLIVAGSDHRKFMRQIFVSVDIEAPLYWWKEFDTYKVATVSNSCSTMHKIHERHLHLTDFSTDKLMVSGIARLNETISLINYYIDLLKETNNKKYFDSIIQLLPSSYNQIRTVTLNYETLRNIYLSRRNHKLSEWSEDFMMFIDHALPYSEELIKWNT